LVKKVALVKTFMLDLLQKVQRMAVVALLRVVLVDAAHGVMADQVVVAVVLLNFLVVLVT
jgi:hypothetical protein